MAEGTVTDPAYVTQLTEALTRELPDAQIGHEQVRRDRYRFVVVSKSFESVGHPERQRIVWDVAERVLDRGDLLNVSMIVTMAPSEAE